MNNFETSKSPISNRKKTKRTSSESLFEDIELSEIQEIEENDPEDGHNEDLLYWMKERIVTHTEQFSPRDMNHLAQN